MQAQFIFLTGLLLALALAAMALQRLRYRRQIKELEDQLLAARRETEDRLERDALTGLLSRSALERRLDQPGNPGVVAVVDLDEFRHLNEKLGHLGGDEVLRAIGRFLQSSIRQEDEAFRWGGDEFVLLLGSLSLEVARQRMGAIEKRLGHFQLRKYGQVPVGASWGIAESSGRSLRESLDEADRAMYAQKRNRSPAP